MHNSLAHKNSEIPKQKKKGRIMKKTIQSITLAAVVLCTTSVTLHASIEESTWGRIKKEHIDNDQPKGAAKPVYLIDASIENNATEEIEAIPVIGADGRGDDLLVRQGNTFTHYTSDSGIWYQGDSFELALSHVSKVEFVGNTLFALDAEVGALATAELQGGALGPWAGNIGAFLSRGAVAGVPLR